MVSLPQIVKKGCGMCRHLGRYLIDAQDATSGWYCKSFDPDFNSQTGGFQLRVKYEGFSPKVKRHYEDPCEDYLSN